METLPPSHPPETRYTRYTRYRYPTRYQKGQWRQCGSGGSAGSGLPGDRRYGSGSRHKRGRAVAVRAMRRGRRQAASRDIWPPSRVASRRMRPILAARARGLGMTRRRSARPEDIIQRAVIKHLRTRPAPGVFAFHVPNGGKRKPIEAAILTGLGVVAGVPDIFAIRAGHAYALELKADAGRLSPAQEQTIHRLRAAGATTAVAHGLDAALHQLEDWGLLRGATS